MMTRSFCGASLAYPSLPVPLPVFSDGSRPGPDRSVAGAKTFFSPLKSPHITSRLRRTLAATFRYVSIKGDSDDYS